VQLLSAMQDMGTQGILLCRDKPEGEEMNTYKDSFMFIWQSVPGVLGILSALIVFAVIIVVVIAIIAGTIIGVNKLMKHTGGLE
jgi:hypothetical protein